MFNPTSEQRKVSDLDVTVVSTRKKVVMIEAGANEVPNDKMFEAIKMAHEENQKIIALIDQMVAEVGKPKFEYPHADFNRSCSTRSWRTSWTRPRLPWTPTTRTSGRPAGTP